MLKDLKVKSKLLTAFLAMAAIVCLTGAAGIYYATSVGSDGTHVGDELVPLGDAAMEIKISATQAHLLSLGRRHGERERGLGTSGRESLVRPCDT